MMNLWSGRTHREKVLLVAAFLVLLIAAIWQIGLKPALSGLEAARNNHQRAAQTLQRLDRIEQLDLAGQRLSPPQSARATESLSSEIAQHADRLGLDLTASPTSPAGQVRVDAEAASAPPIFLWLETIEQELELSASSVFMRQSPGGQVQITVEFSSGTNP